MIVILKKSENQKQKIKINLHNINFFSCFNFFLSTFLPPNEQTKWTQSFLNIGINVFIFVVLILDYFLRWITYPMRAGKFSSMPLLFFPLTGASVIKADIPLSEMFGYSTDLRTMTSGRGNYQMQFDHYEKAPKNISDEIIKKRNIKE